MASRPAFAWLQMLIFFYSQFNQCRTDSRFVLIYVSYCWEEIILARHTARPKDKRKNNSVLTPLLKHILVFKFYLVLFWEKWETRRDNRLLKKKLWRRISYDRSQRPWSDVFMYMSLFMGSLSGYHSVSSEQYSIQNIFQLFKINK